MTATSYQRNQIARTARARNSLCEAFAFDGDFTAAGFVELRA